MLNSSIEMREDWQQTKSVVVKYGEFWHHSSISPGIVVSESSKCMIIFFTIKHEQILFATDEQIKIVRWVKKKSLNATETIKVYYNNNELLSESLERMTNNDPAVYGSKRIFSSYSFLFRIEGQVKIALWTLHGLW